MRRGKAAMDETGILPRFTGTLVRDGFSSYMWYGQCRHSLCNAHLLRDLVFVEEVAPNQKVWTTPLSKLLLKIKSKVAEVNSELDEPVKSGFLRLYDRLVKKAASLNPPKSVAIGDVLIGLLERVWLPRQLQQADPRAAR